MAEFFDFGKHPGHLYVVATLLPLLSFLIILLGNGLRSYLLRFVNQEKPNPPTQIYNFLGGDRQDTRGSWIATGAIFLSFCLSVVGFSLYSSEDHHHAGHSGHAHHHHHEEGDAHHHEGDEEEGEHDKWSGSIWWVQLTFNSLPDNERATGLELGYKIDYLAAIMFLMVTFIATLIHLFSMGYMSEELEDEVVDHEVHTKGGHLHRRSRYTRFFSFLSLFCFSMLNLLLANNLFQIFVSWELVGICSFLLIGFYYERTSASNAANKAFITNRIGDAGFIIGLLIVWTYFGTFNFEEIFQRVRPPVDDAHGHVIPLGQKVVRGNVLDEEAGLADFEIAEDGGYALVMPRKPHIHAENLQPFTEEEDDEGRVQKKKTVIYAIETGHQEAESFGVIPYWMLVLAGLGIFLGCVGKSAQFPLHVWLPDAMEGPTPVSALIHAATMVAAGVYLVGRVYPIFTPEVLLVIAYTGAITLFVAATIAVVMTDIKKVLAYSTVSQLGYMMLALGIGGWVAGLFHLVTHAFFKALLFLGSGSVIFGCHHVQEMTKMGGLYPKMKITALTMLIGVFAICGIPLFSGWYSKDAIIAQAVGFGVVRGEHILLLILPLVTAGITTFYMFRMWFMTFTGEPKDHHVYEHAKESPWTMTVPLMLLALFSIIVAWGWPVWDAEASWLEHTLHHDEPKSVIADFGLKPPGKVHPHNVPGPAGEESIRAQASELHHEAGYMALGTVIIGFVFASSIYYFRVLDTKESGEKVASVNTFLSNKWYFDEFYTTVLVKPAVRVAHWCKSFDLNIIDGFIHMVAWLLIWGSKLGGLIDKYIVDGLVNWISEICYGIGERLRNVQTGYLRSYILFLVLAAVGIWVLLSLIWGSPAPAMNPK